MKKISAAFDGLKFSKGTLEYAMYVAQNSKALLAGIFLDDFTYHSYKVYDMVGSQGISKEKIKLLMNKDKETRLKATAAFEYACIQAHINYVVDHDKNFASQELIKESIYSDLLLIGTDETFSHFHETSPTEFIKTLLTDVQCPVLIVPNEYQPIEKVILLYDGKPSSVYAIKMFNYMMPWMKTIGTEVLSVVDPNDSSDIPDEEQIKEFIKCHYPDVTYTTLYGNPEEEIIKYLSETGQNHLVVLGAYQRSSVSRWFKVSMADTLMKNISMPLFIAHNK